MDKTGLKMCAMLLPLALTACSDKSGGDAKVIEKPEIKIENGMLTPEVLEAFGRISEATPSPDGTKIIFTLTYEDIDPEDRDVLCTVTFTKTDDKKQIVERSADIHITPNFKNTVAYLREHNIYQRVAISPKNVDKIMVNNRNETVRELTDTEAIARLLEDYRKGSFSKAIPEGERYEITAVMKGGEYFFLGETDSLSYLPAP